MNESKIEVENKKITVAVTTYNTLLKSSALFMSFMLS